VADLDFQGSLRSHHCPGVGGRIRWARAQTQSASIPGDTARAWPPAARRVTPAPRESS